jgi:metallo-beta-lactamase class B
MKRPILIGLACAIVASAAAATDWPAAWHEPTEPFHVVGNIYYVGSKGIAAYLIVSPKGDILLDGTEAENGAMIERNIAKLGFNIRDVKVLLNNHAHFDHAGALAQLKADSGATFLANPRDKAILESGHITLQNSNDLLDFPPVKVDRTLRDGEVVRVGPIEMTAIFTPGHTPGCTSWTTDVRDHGRTLAVVFPCSITVGGNPLVGNKSYPDIAGDFRRSFARLERLKADVVLPGHPELADVQGRAARRRDDGPDAFVDPGQLQRLVANARRDFEQELAKEKAAAR